ncbi:MAG: SufD family Fe-S cluster assembly protein [Candidatus Hodgkinia cicadicola]
MVGGIELKFTVNDVLALSKLRREPSWMTNWRINAFYCLMFRNVPKWSEIQNSKVEVKINESHKDWDYLENNKVQNRDIDIIYNSTSVYLNLTKELKRLNISFAPLSKAILLFPKLIRRYMGSVVFHNDNYYSALNASVFTDGTFVRIPKHVKCPVSLSTYFKITAKCAGQFERTLIVIESHSNATYFEGCNSTKMNKAILHCAVVEIVIWDNGNLKYTTLQNWNSLKLRGIWNFVTKRALCRGVRSKICWTQVEIGSSATWKYPSTVLLGFAAKSEFYSLSISNREQRVDTGTKCIHLGSKSTSLVIAKSIIMGQSVNVFRVLVASYAKECRSYIKCDSLLTNTKCVAKAFPIVVANTWPIMVEYESLNSYVTEGQLNYCAQRRLSEMDAIKLIISGYANEIVSKLPLEAALEVAKLLIL